MIAIELTPEQVQQIEPTMKQACTAGGTVFCQCRRLAFPNNDKLTVTCHMIPAESSKRLRAFLTKEALRISTPKQITP